MIVPFKEATLFYGLSRYPVEKNAVNPFEDFDTQFDLMEQAFKAIAIVSSASGGFLFKHCTLRVHEEFVGINGSGFHIKWGDASVAYITDPIRRARALLRIIDQSLVYPVLFDMRTARCGIVPKTVERA